MPMYHYFHPSANNNKEYKSKTAQTLEGSKGTKNNKHNNKSILMIRHKAQPVSSVVGYKFSVSSEGTVLFHKSATGR